MPSFHHACCCNPCEKVPAYPYYLCSDEPIDLETTSIIGYHAVEDVPELPYYETLGAPPVCYVVPCGVEETMQCVGPIGTPRCFNLNQACNGQGLPNTITVKFKDVELINCYPGTLPTDPRGTITGDLNREFTLTKTVATGDPTPFWCYTQSNFFTSKSYPGSDATCSGTPSSTSMLAIGIYMDVTSTGAFGLGMNIMGARACAAGGPTSGFTIAFALNRNCLTNNTEYPNDFDEFREVFSPTNNGRNGTVKIKWSCNGEDCDENPLP